MRTFFHYRKHIGILILALLLTACEGEFSVTPTQTASPAVYTTSSATNTPRPPTPTPLPLAARVNGEGVTVAELDEEFSRFLSGKGLEDPVPESDARQQVLDDLIIQILLAQGARESGFTADESIIESRVEQVIAAAGGEQNFNSWLEENEFTRESFELSLTRSLEAARMRDEIMAMVQQTAEQVHARQILLYDPNQAAQVLVDLRAGTDFATLATYYDPVTGGDIGWFPRGYLIDAQLEEAAFNLQPGEYTEVIETSAGFHILQVIERDPGRALEPEALLTVQENALREWIESRRDQAQIEILIP
jgi:peptidyl-prolyl cis-trans isomerase C